jgi:hypothetical protein
MSVELSVERVDAAQHGTADLHGGVGGGVGGFGIDEVDATASACVRSSCPFIKRTLCEFAGCGLPRTGGKRALPDRLRVQRAQPWHCSSTVSSPV